MRMATRLTPPLVALALVLPDTGAAQHFEGVLTMREVRFQIDPMLETAGGSAEDLLQRSLEQVRAAAEAAGAGVEELSLSYYLKGNKLRTSTEAGSDEAEGYMLLDFGSGLYQLVDPAQKLIVEWTADSSGGEVVADESADPGAEIQALDETRTVNGFVCRGFRVVHEGGTVEITWLTDSLQDLKGAFAELVALSERFGDEGAASRPLDRVLELGFPVLTMTVDIERGEFSAAEVLKVEKKPLDDTLFAAPAGYLKVAMPQGGSP